MQLLIEHLDQELTPLVEAMKDSKGITYIEGPFLMAGRKNRNGRVYPKKVMEGSVDKYIKEYVNERRAIGELNHPPNRPFADMKEAAIIIESLEWRGDDVYGKARVLDNPNGMIIKSLLEANFKMGVSSRGLAELKKLKEYTEVKSFMLNAIDAVDRPSGQVCYVNPVNESMVNEWVEVNGVWQQKKAFDVKLFENALDEMLETLKKPRT